MQDYQEKAIRTSARSKDYFNDFVSNTQFQRDLQGFLACANRLEITKKQLAYGKNVSKIPTVDPLRHPNLDVLHAKLGICGEAGEVMDANSPEDIKEEVGDLLWYIAVLLDQYNFSLTEVMEANIAKLEKRYPSNEFVRTHSL